jgi:hypothetical protein
MISGVHVTIFTAEENELRAFIRDQLGLPFHDVGEGWLIFDLPRVELGIHPTNQEDLDPEDLMGKTWQELSFFCDDIYETVSQLKERGVEFTREILDEEYGLVTRFSMPGGIEVDLYQPKY